MTPQSVAHIRCVLERELRERSMGETWDVVDPWGVRHGIQVARRALREFTEAYPVPKGKR